MRSKSEKWPETKQARIPKGCEPLETPDVIAALLLGSAALETRSLQHLFVLLFSHALTALLNQRTHGRTK